MSLPRSPHIPISFFSSLSKHTGIYCFIIRAFFKTCKMKNIHANVHMLALCVIVFIIFTTYYLYLPPFLSHPSLKEYTNMYVLLSLIISCLALYNNKPCVLTRQRYFFQKIETIISNNTKALLGSLSRSKC